MAVKLQVSAIGGFITTAEAARILGCRADYMYRLLRDGAITCMRIGNYRGGTLLFKRADVEALAVARPRIGKNRKAS